VVFSLSFGVVPRSVPSTCNSVGDHHLLGQL
jgi:hypothetical protein